jgi:hypothetical protein
MTNAATALSGDAPAAAPAAASVDAGTTAVDAGAQALSQAAAAAAPAAAANDAWWAKIENQDVRTWAEAKQYADPVKAAEAHYNLEKLLGFEKAGRTLVVPGENATPEEIKAFQQKLGVPESADKYEIPVPAGMDDTFAKEAKGWFHEAGIPAPAAAKLAEKWNAYMESAEQQAEQQFIAQSENDFNSWKAEQGAAYDQNLELYKRACAQFIPADNLEQRKDLVSKIERAIGTATFMKMMASVGSGLAEHKMVGGGEGGLVLTPAQAQQRINELRSNKDWSTAYLQGDKQKLAEMENLQKLAVGESTNG